MDRLFFFLGDIHHTKLGGADTFTDQLSCKYTVFLLSLFALLSTTRVYVSDPISCFCPANFPGSQVDYTDKFCWSTNTHYLPFENEHLPKDHEHKNVISYYQWVPLFLACQALLFYLPRPIWRAMSRKAGITISNITDAAIDCQRKAEQEGTDKIMKYMTRYTNRFLQEVHRRRSEPSPVGHFRRLYYENYLTTAYIFVKTLYVVNVLGQLFVLDCFLGTDYHLYGFDVVRRMAVGEDWTTSHRFPRVTICDFHIRVLGNVHRHTVQCALPMNLYNEMMFVFFWFWFVVVGVVTVGSLCVWLSHAVCRRMIVGYVRDRLLATGSVRRRRLPRLTSTTKIGGCGSSSVESGTCCVDAAEIDDLDGSVDVVGQFVDKYLFRDGYFIVRMVAKNSSELVAAELLAGIYEQFIKSRVLQPRGIGGSGSHGMDDRDPTTDRNDNQPTGLGSVPTAPDYTMPRYQSKSDLVDRIPTNA